ncbi:MAG: AMP-dependent synthetase/ligase [Planctomycetota bacterium]|jgi:long-chain acyl-CoA synthetase
METVNGYFFQALKQFRDEPCQVHHDRTWTFGDAAAAMHGIAQHLKGMGIEPGDRVAIIAENSPRWMHVFGGILAAGGVIVPRGEDITEEELAYILEHSGAKVVFHGRRDVPGNLPAISMIEDPFPEPVPVDDATLDQYAALRGPEELVTLLYTSGTTGTPKGVMLEQRNVAHNIRVLPPIVGMEKGDTWVSILPSWHTFEQTVELIGVASGGVIVYSDKRRLKDDLVKHRPQFFASVPRIWQSIYDGATSAIRKKGAVVHFLFRFAMASSRMKRNGNPLGSPGHALGKALFYSKIRAVTGGRLKFAISGGGYLPMHIDEFFSFADVNLLIGYGLTETAPVIALRAPEDNVLGTIGRAVPETELRVGQHGTFEARGPQIMRGYYKQDDMTRAVIDDEGWLDTGDLGRITEKGDLVFLGRAKETIVLSGGENLEPEPVETAMVESPLIHQAMLVGQDRKAVAALVVAEQGSGVSEDQLLAEARSRTAGFRSFERVNRITVLEEPFSVENGLLTATLKMRRNVIAERFRSRIDALYG